MRFGILFFGYLWLFVCKGFEMYPDILPDIVPNIVAYTLMLYSLLKLEEQNRYFKSARKILHFIIVFVLFYDLYRIYNFTSTPIENDIINNVISSYKILSSLAFLLYHYYFFKGIGILATDVNLPGIKKSSQFNFYFYLAVNLLLIISQLRLFSDYSQYIGIVYVLLNFIWLILTCVMVYRCYMWICLEGDEDMSKRKRGS